MSTRRRKVLWVILAMVAGALEPIVAKYSYRFGIQPLQLFVIRNIAAGLVLAPFIFRNPNLSFANIKKVLPVSILLMATAFCTLVALNYLTAVTVITVVTTTPAIVALLNQRLNRDVLAKYFWLGFIMCFVGVLLSLDLDTFNAHPFGLLSVIVAIFTSSFYRVKMEELTDEIPPGFCACLCFAWIAIISLPGLAFVPSPPLSLLPLCLAIGVAAAIANYTFVTAMTKVGATRISIIAMAQRPLLIIFAAVVLREQPTAIQIAGIVMVMIGMNYARVERIEPTGEVVQVPVAQTEP